MPVPATPFDIPAASAQLAAGRMLVMGVIIGESSGVATAKVRIRDGVTVAGTRVLPFTLAANESVRDWFGDYGIVYEQGLFVEVVAGAVEGSIAVVLESRIGPGAFARLVHSLVEGVEHVS